LQRCKSQSVFWISCQQPVHSMVAEPADTIKKDDGVIGVGGDLRVLVLHRILGYTQQLEFPEQNRISLSIITNLNPDSMRLWRAGDVNPLICGESVNIRALRYPARLSEFFSPQDRSERTFQAHFKLHHSVLVVQRFPHVRAARPTQEVSPRSDHR